jgi:hypothetical protein
MKRQALSILWGLLLILAGVFFILDLVGFIAIGDYQWAIILALGGLAFLSVFISDRNQWWSLFPGFALLVAGTILYLETAFPHLPDDLGGIIATGGIGLAFLIIFLINIANWWALIPAGVLLSIAVGLLLSALVPSVNVGGIFLIGLGITFGIIGILPTQQGRMRWAFIPALVLIVIGFFILIASFNLFSVLWPLGLIAAGILIIYTVMRTRG